MTYSKKGNKLKNCNLFKNNLIVHLFMFKALFMLCISCLQRYLQKIRKITVIKTETHKKKQS